ncbi:MAG: NAD+ synthase [Nocardioidaceae bacterium]|nr:NAD+ synthase [Nocardioidaceae bacterium]
MPQLRVALAQVNATVGDLAGNAAVVADTAERAARAGAHLAAFPELVLTGYPVEDLALRSSYVEAARRTTAELAARLDSDGLGELVVVVGTLDRAELATERLGVPKGSPHNTAAVMHRGRVVARQAKHHLPNYGVFDEARYFVPGDTIEVLRVRGVDVALAICEDLWQDGPAAMSATASAGLLLVINGSPYERAKDDVRLDLCARRAKEAGCPLAYVNLVGGQDELVFDGDSLVVDVDGTVIARAAQFSEQLLTVDLELSAPPPANDPRQMAHLSAANGLRLRSTVLSEEPVPTYEPATTDDLPRLDELAEVWQAVVVGLRDYVRKNGFDSVCLGLSGGIDSAVTAVLAADALGADRVHAVSMPSRYSTEHSTSDAAELAERTGISYDVVPINDMVMAFTERLALTGLAEENLQARCRGVILMALSNQHGYLVLATGNKSELSVGYSTLYGDAVGGFAPIKDVPKTLVWQLARWRNDTAERAGETPPIPAEIIAKPPSAELRPGQLDTDSLPDYALLDDILDDYVERDASSAELVARGFDAEVVEQVLRLVDRAEFKRRQYPPGPKISARNFGRDRRLPITSRWREHR